MVLAGYWTGQMSNDDREFLLREYDSAVKLTYHDDDLRAKLTAAYVGLAAAVATAAAAVSGGPFPTAMLLFGLSVIGGNVVIITARLRRVQLEHFRIIDNIRRHFLGSNPKLQNVVELSRETLPKPTRLSGSYFWVLAIMLSSVLLAAAGTFVLYEGSSWVAGGLSATTVAVLAWMLLDWAYFSLVQAPSEREYDGLPSSD